MKWPFFRRKSKGLEESTAAHVGSAVTSVSVLDRPSNLSGLSGPTGPLGSSVELRDALLRFARDVLVASGAHVRVEDADVLSAVLQDGTSVRYTTTLARARDEEHTELLVEGGGALTELVERCGERARVTSLRLSPDTDAEEMVRQVWREPPSDCPRCADVMGQASEHTDAFCAACPLRSGGFALRGIGRLKDVREARRWEAESIELSYLLTARDRQGRRDEWLRLAFDTQTGTSVPVVSVDAASRADSIALTESVTESVREAIARAGAVVNPALRATGAFLGMRNESDYYARLDDIQNKHERLRREAPESADAITASLAREIERLGEVFAVDVEASLQRVCVIVSSKAVMQARTRDGKSFDLTVDLGRGVVEPLACSECGASTRAGVVCARGHVLCRRCAVTSNGSRECLVCAGSGHGRDEPGSDAERVSVAHSGGDDGLTIDHLDVMTPFVWSLFCVWLLEQDGCALDRHEVIDDRVQVWYGRREGESLIACALRLPDHWQLGEADVRQVADLRATTPASRIVLLSTASVSAEAQTAAQRLQVQVVDRAALAARLEQVSRAREEAIDTALHEATARAAAACALRDEVLSGLRALEKGLAAANNTRRATGGSVVAEATATVADIYRTAQQAFFAWEAVLADWTAAFGERGARDGSLSIVEDVAFFEALGERVRHLHEALTQAFTTLGETPGAGELGYSAWRRGVLEECTARCEHLRWRMLSIDPAQWREFVLSQDTQAQEQAEVASTSASHAAARVSKAYTQLRTRVRLPATGTES